MMSHKIWENRNLGAVVWQVAPTLNGKGRDRRKTEVKSMEERREEEAEGSEKGGRQGSKSSKTQCVTQRHQ